MSAMKPRTTTVVIFQGDDLDPIEERRKKVEEAAVQADSPRRLGDNISVKAAAKEYDDFLEEAAARGESVELQAVGRKVWREMLKQHPPRKVTEKDPDTGADVETDHPEDAGWGFNYEELCDDLVPASVVDKGRYDESFLDSLSDGDFSRLYSAAVVLNQGAGPDPKARISSRIGPMSDDTSESPARLA